MQLIEIDVIGTEPAEAAVTLGVDISRARRPVGRVAVHPEAELRENQRSLRRRQLLDRSADNFLGMAGPVDRGGVDPVDAVVDRGVNGIDAQRIVLSTPHVAADRPGPQTNRRHLETAAPQLSSLHAHS
jgi:hypothetical protein